MATSGSINYTRNTLELITEAYDLSGIYGQGRTISTSDVNSAYVSLNLMIKSREFQTLHRWTKEEGVLFLTKDIAKYELGNTAKAALDEDVNIFYLTVAASSSDTTITVDSTTDLTVGDNIGICLSDGTIQWTTVDSIPTSTTITLAAALTGAASLSAHVYTYTTALKFPFELHNVRRTTGINTTRNDILLAEMSSEEYYSSPNKLQSGTVTSYYYVPKLNSIHLYIWQIPKNSTEYLRFTFFRKLEDFDADTDDVDFPQDWLECLAYNLAARLCLKFGKFERYQILRQEGLRMLDELAMFDTDIDSIKIKPKLN